MTTGLTLNNTQNGGAFIGSAGDDTMTNSGNVVLVEGAQGNDSITSSGSSDTINGGAGNNTIVLTGTGTNNMVHGGISSINDASGGSNTLFTYAIGVHNDTLASHDILVARDGTGNSNVVTTTVSNFAPGDVIELSTSHGIHLVTSANLSSIITSHIADNSSGNAVLTLGGETITFTGVHTSALTASEFTLIA